ncbi:MAG: rRNA maturation RNase YbeY [bacterium]|nr:rRNA maturation RNase YbeY [bacterium]
MIDIMDDDFQVDKAVYLEKLEAIMAELELEGTFSIKLGGDEESQALNMQYREKDYPTDVLSFPLNEELPESEGFYLGDIFICHPVAERQAEENEVSLQHELFTLMVHGLLHLAGYDHEEDDGEMLALQDRLVDKYFPENQ